MLELALAARSVAAHALPPAPVSLVMQDAQGPQVVRLTAGLSQRQPDGSFRYVCPALWGDTDSLPAYGLPGQPAVVLSSTGLWLLHDDGHVSAHPDPLAQGYAFDLAAHSGKLFVLRSPDRLGSELVEVTAERVTRVWEDAELWTTLAAGADFLALARLTDDGQLVQQKLALDGTPLERVQAQAPRGVVNVLARGAGRDLYLVLASGGTRQLGRLAERGFEPLRTANTTIAGPVQSDDGSVYLALDGALGRLLDGAWLPLQEASAADVSCLGCYERQCYACTREGLQPLSAAGLEPPIFALSQLIGPRVEGLTQEVRTACDLQWQHLRFDVLGLGVELQDTGAAGSTAAASGAGVKRRPAPESDGGCGVGGRGHAGGIWLWCGLFAWARLRRRCS